MDNILKTLGIMMVAYIGYRIGTKRNKKEEKVLKDFAKNYSYFEEWATEMTNKINDIADKVYKA